MSNKYNAKKMVIDNTIFDSKAEAHRYLELLSLQQAGEIADLRCQPEFELLPAFTTRWGERVRAIKYTADFQYTQAGRVVVEDVKGFATRDYSLRKKLFQWNFDDIEFREVK
jgi:hypothetical protein